MELNQSQAFDSRAGAQRPRGTAVGAFHFEGAAEADEIAGRADMFGRHELAIG